MKTIYQLLLALGALLGLVAVGLFLLIRGAFNVADHALHVTANGVDKVVGVAEKQTSGVVQAVKAEVKDMPARQMAKNDDNTPAAPAADQAATAPAAADKPQTADVSALGANDNSAKPVNAQVATAKKPAAKKSGNEVEDDLADVGQLFKMLLSEGDDSGDGGDIAAAIPGATSKSDGGDDLTSLVPGGDSPTLRGVMAGKYKGKEGKIIDDALDDPKAWRLLFFLGGGM